MKLFCGVDEAGRGPVIGPMVMAIVACSDKDKQFLNKIGVKDSKQISPEKRTKLARLIKVKCPSVTIKVSPKEIDKALRSETSSLNCLEADTTRKLINRLVKKIGSENIQKIILDLPSKNKEEYLKRVMKKMDSKELIHRLDAEFKADENHVEASAASILAKTTRDASMKTLSKKLAVALGSGYPADPNTKLALKNNLDFLLEEGILRTEWKTVKNALESKKQTSLNNFQ